MKYSNVVSSNYALMHSDSTESNVTLAFRAFGWDRASPAQISIGACTATGGSECSDDLQSAPTLNMIY